MDRRRFLGISAGTLGLAAAGFAFWPKPSALELYSSYGDWPKAWIDKIDPQLPSNIVFFSRQNFAVRSYPIPFRFHAGLQNPLNKSHVILVSKWAEQLGIFDRQAGQMVKMVTLPTGRRFFGHGVWDLSGEGFWVTENDDVGNKGYLVLRNANLEVIREIPSNGVYPHELKMPAVGVLQIANTGDFKDNSGNFSILNSSDGSVIKCHDFKEQKGLAGPSHFVQSERTGEVFIGSITANDETPSCVWRVGKNGETKLIETRVKGNKLFHGEVVSIVENPITQMVFWTQAQTKGVFGLSLAPGAEAEVKMRLYARGMISDEDRIIVARKNELLVWKDGDLDTKNVGPSIPDAKFGAHICRLEV